MPSPIKSWIMTNSTNYASDGKLFLGQILTDPLNPESALITGSPRQLPATLHVDQTTTERPVIQSRSLIEHSGGFWLEAYGCNAGVSAEAGSLGKSHVKWEIERLIGKITTFSLAYVKNTVLAEADVTAHVKSRLNPRPTLFIITGVRIFEGAKLIRTDEQGSGAQIRIAADGTPHNIPVQVGVGGHHTRAAHTSQSFEQTSGFVFAYQCNKINYFPWARMEPYTGGQTASSDATDNQNREKSTELVLNIEDGKHHVQPVEFGSDDDDAEGINYQEFGDQRYFEVTK